MILVMFVLIILFGQMKAKQLHAHHLYLFYLKSLCFVHLHFYPSKTFLPMK